MIGWVLSDLSSDVLVIKVLISKNGAIGVCSYKDMFSPNHMEM